MMRRELAELTGRVHDLLVVGGGIHGACIAWDAALRGLAVALVDRGDFGAGTSANSLRIAHGGLRYLARGDFRRMRESIRERSRLLSIAPGLVVPMPVLVPTHGATVDGRLAMRAALALNDLGSLDRNRGLSPEHRIPAGRVLSRGELVRLFPPLAGSPVTGAALWHDARVRSPERLTLSFVRSACSRGATAANYVEVVGILVSSGAAHGVSAVDRRGGASLEIRARAVVVAAGPWTVPLVALATGGGPAVRPHQAVALNLMVGRQLAPLAVGLRAPSGPAEDPVIGGHRYIFLAPQEGSTLLGTWYAVDEGSDPGAITARGAEALRREFQAACPGLGLEAPDVARLQVGWLPLKAGLEQGRPTALADRPRVRDHSEAGVRHLFSVEGVKYTTARCVAEDTVDLIVGRLGFRALPCRTAATPLEGAHVVPASDPHLPARIRESVREEMALTLADVVFRRTGIGEPPGPSRPAVEQTALTVGAELGWNAATRIAEIQDVMRQADGPRAVHRMVTA